MSTASSSVIDLLPTCILHIDSLGMHSTDNVSRLVKKYLAAYYHCKDTKGKKLPDNLDLDNFFLNKSLPVINCNSVVR